MTSLQGNVADVGLYMRSLGLWGGQGTINAPNIMVHTNNMPRHPVNIRGLFQDYQTLQLQMRLLRELGDSGITLHPVLPSLHYNANNATATGANQMPAPIRVPSQQEGPPSESRLENVAAGCWTPRTLHTAGQGCLSHPPKPAVVQSDDAGTARRAKGQGGVRGGKDSKSSIRHAAAVLKAGTENCASSKATSPSIVMGLSVVTSNDEHRRVPLPKKLGGSLSLSPSLIKKKGKRVGLAPFAGILPLPALPAPEAAPASGPSRSFLATILYDGILDDEHLTAYQCELRRHLEVFVAGPDDVRASASPGRTGLVKLGQVGLRCRHCATTSCPPLATRTRGATNYSQTISGMYQLAQNMTKGHLCERCYYIPRDVQRHLDALRNDNRRAKCGRDYWTSSIRAMGVYESTGEGILRMSDGGGGRSSIK